MTQSYPAQIRVPATYIRGGTSKGVFFNLADLPPPAQQHGPPRDALLLRVIGSPDPYGKHTDGMGGATSSTSKTVIVSRSKQPGHITSDAVPRHSRSLGPRASCKNIIDSRWVTTWKMIEGVLGIKCRLTARGFKDKMQEQTLTKQSLFRLEPMSLPVLESKQIGGMVVQTTVIVTMLLFLEILFQNLCRRDQH